MVKDGTVLIDKTMTYNNGKIPAVGDLIVAKLPDRMVAGVVTSLVPGLNKLTVVPIQLVTDAAGPNQVQAWPSTDPSAVLVGSANCLLETDIAFAPVNQPPPH